MRSRNRDLPILDELGAEFAALVGESDGRGTGDGAGRGARGRGQEEPALPDEGERGPARLSQEDPARSHGGERHAVRRRAPAASSRAAHERRSQVSRVGRRTATVLLLLCLVGGVAFAALRGGDTDTRVHTAPVPLGRADDGAWTLSAYRNGGQVCGVFLSRGGDLGSRCAGPLRAGRIWARSAVAGGRRYVFGLTGRGVAKVVVSPAETDPGRAGARPLGARVSLPVDPHAATEAGLSAADHWFVVDLGSSTRANRRTSILVTPFDRAGRRAGPGYVDCSLGIVGEACRRRIETVAAHRRGRSG